MRLQRRYQRVRTMPRRGMGDLASVLTTALDVAGDPYLPELACQIAQLKHIDHGEPVTACAATPEGVIGGVGLRNAIGPMRAYVYAQQNTWVYPVAIALILGLPMLVGYELGKGAK